MPSIHLAENQVKLIRPLTWVALVTLGTCGCAGFWDEVTSRNRDLKGYFIKPEPLVVLRDCPDGAKRAQALAALREPLPNGGTQADQDKILHILTLSALGEKDPATRVGNDPLCRLGAIRALAHWKDPRAVKVLEDVYYQKLPFDSDTNSLIRQQVLVSMEETGIPEARHLLIRAARQPNATGTEKDRQQALDERLTATRGLAKFKQSDATETLLYVLETEKDVALRDRAHESLKAATGRRLPPDPKMWAELLHDPQSLLAKEPNVIQRAVGWVEDVLPFTNP